MERSDIMFLISEVQKRSILWQDTHKDFKNRQITDKLWDEVGEKCNCTGVVAKSKWKNLKDTYRKNLQKLSTAESTFAKTPVHIKWPYFEPMSFIKDLIAPEVGQCNFLMPDEYRCAQEEKNFSEIFQVKFVDESCSSNVTLPKISSPLQHSKKNSPKGDILKKYKRKRSSLLDINKQMLEIERERLELLKKNRYNEAAECSDLQFFKSLLPFMGKFSETEKLEIRGDIQKIILSKLQSKQPDHEQTNNYGVKVEETNDYV